MSSSEIGNLCAPGVVRKLLATEGTRPRKRWGQNFLVDLNILQKIVRAANVDNGTGVLEIGAGVGALTLALAQNSKQVVAVEIDRALVRILSRTLAGVRNVRVVEGDFFDLPFADLLAPLEDLPIVVSANPPYYITSPIIERLLEHKSRFRRISLLVQREYASRLSAVAGTPEYGALTLFATYHSEVRTEFVVPRTAFYPMPEVASAVVTFVPLSPRLSERAEWLFFACTRSAFRERRKILVNALTSGMTGTAPRETIQQALQVCGIDAGRRGETLSLQEYLSLATRLADAL